MKNGVSSVFDDVDGKLYESGKLNFSSYRSRWIASSNLFPLSFCNRSSSFLSLLSFILPSYFFRLFFSFFSFFFLFVEVQLQEPLHSLVMICSIAPIAPGEMRWRDDIYAHNRDNEPCCSAFEKSIGNLLRCL